MKNDIEYIHQPNLGISAVVLNTAPGNFTVSMSFSHKAGPSGRQNFEQFSRRKGRAICEGRARGNWTDPNLPPYTFVVNGVYDNIKEVAKVVKTTLLSISDSIEDINIVNSKREQQLENNDVFDQVSSNVQNKVMV